MKNIVTAISLLLLTFLIIFGIMAIATKNERDNKMVESLETSTEEAIENTLEEKDYSISSNEEFVADFVSKLINRVGTGNIDSKGVDNKDDNLSVDVEICAVDYESGLITIKVKEEYSYPFFPTKKKGECEYTTTAVLETSSDNSTYKIEYLNEDGELYKQYIVQGGADVPIPKNPPTIEGKTFKGWVDENGNDPNEVYSSDYVYKSHNFVALYQ